MKKYEFTGETKQIGDTILKQIIAVRSFEDVAEGDVGGWIEKEGNLSHDGNAWVCGDSRVYGDACVYGDTRVFGNAWVYGDARVFDGAWVFGDTMVYGHAMVSGNAKVFGYARVFGGKFDKSPLYIQGTRHSITLSDNEKNIISIGCESMTIDEWLENYESVGKANKYTETEIEEYGNYIKLISKRIGR